MINRETLLIPPSMQGYVNRVKEADILEGIYRNTKQFRKLLNTIPKKKIDYAYAPGKWTLKEMLQHIVDGERVFAFRALHFARKDANPLPGFDENQWADNSQAGARKWKDLVNEFFALRTANELLFASLNEEQLQYNGVANNHPTSVAALALVTAGHLDHHIAVIRERYLQAYPAPAHNGVESEGKKKKDGLKKDAKKASKKEAKKTSKASKASKKTSKKDAKNKKLKNGAIKKDIGFPSPKKPAGKKTTKPVKAAKEKPAKSKPAKPKAVKKK